MGSLASYDTEVELEVKVASVAIAGIASVLASLR